MTCVIDQEKNIVFMITYFMITHVHAQLAFHQRKEWLVEIHVAEGVSEVKILIF